MAYAARTTSMRAHAGQLGPTFRARNVMLQRLESGLWELELSFQCTGLPRCDLIGKSDPFVVVMTRDSTSNSDSDWRESVRTETIFEEQANARFVSKFIRSFASPADAKLEFELVVYDRDAKSETLRRHDLIGAARFRMHQLCSAPDHTLELDLGKSAPSTSTATSPPRSGNKVSSMKSSSNNATDCNHESSSSSRRGVIIVRAVAIPLRGARDVGGELIEVDTRTILFEVRVEKLGFGCSYVLSRQSNTAAVFVPMHRSERVSSSGGAFAAVSVRVSQLLLGEMDTQLRLELYRAGKFAANSGASGKILGYAQVSLKQLLSQNVGSELAWFPAVIDAKEEFKIELKQRAAHEDSLVVSIVTSLASQ
uniref:C2 domain-containing protein n=1 Tax=Erythrolobus madagascarensis TaxID=708628 RepID=A0A7S0T5A3_9RHOD|mmetsp:Transcript_1667/g.3558  ORF Transcript_1667/g.3558 Transcript_1667/m.3558 type:complete len:367 (+) Transcript_1667:245-1345(+)